VTHRKVTRDVDLLGRGASTPDAVVGRIREVLSVEADDGVRFDAGSARGSTIAVDAAYLGVRVLLRADLAGMVIPMQIDVGFGDAVVPEPGWFEYPQLLDLGAPRLLGYPAEATLAEKLHAVVVLGRVNSRMKDYYDLWTADRLGVATAEGLGEAIRHAFERRGTPLPVGLPEGLTAAFAEDPMKRAQWAGFVRKSGLEGPSLAEVVAVAAGLAERGFEVARRGR
jgi:hypothetical protein